MMQNYAHIAFTDEVKRLQTEYGSRNAYARREAELGANGLSEAEAAFISEQDSFYFATQSESGFPYIQHRGGPKGFLKVITPTTIGFTDFRGNKQYITIGNLATNTKASLFLMDYAQRIRLKIFAEARIIPIAEAEKSEPELVRLLAPDDYAHHAERLIVLDIQAIDWNCSQHITPRYTAEQVAKAWEKESRYIASLEAEIRYLKEQLANTHYSPKP